MSAFLPRDNPALGRIAAVVSIAGTLVMIIFGLFIVALADGYDPLPVFGLFIVRIGGVAIAGAIITICTQRLRAGRIGKVVRRIVGCFFFLPALLGGMFAIILAPLSAIGMLPTLGFVDALMFLAFERA